MKRYLYNYQTIVTFSQPTLRHSMILRCQPLSNTFQTIESEHLLLPPYYWLRYSTDAFGNRIVFGGATRPVSTFAYVSTGIVASQEYREKVGSENIYLFTQPSQLTAFTPEMQNMAHVTDIGNTFDKAAHICQMVHNMLKYNTNCTTVETPASDIFSSKRGVCQDFAHLMIALCRSQKIAARYVCGFLKGTGETHAWVEVTDGYNWHAFDPTHNCTSLQGYLKLAHGRDSSDCPVCRGMFCGQATQQTQISVTLQEL